MSGTDSHPARIYLLRYWREAGAHRPPDDGWRFALEDPRTGGRRGFASLAALVTALAATLQEGADAPGPAAGEAHTSAARD